MSDTTESAENVRAAYVAAVYRYMADKHCWDKRHGQFNKHVLMKTAMAKLTEGQHLKPAEASRMLQDSVLLDMLEQAAQMKKALENDRKSMKMQIQVLAGVQEYYNKLWTYEFLHRSPTGLKTLVSGSSSSGALGKRFGVTDKAAEDALTELAAAVQAAQTDESSTVQQVEDLRSSLRHCYLAHTEFYGNLREMAKLVAAAPNAIDTIDEQALYNYFVNEKNDPRKVVEAVKTGEEYITGVASELIPPGHKWIAGLIAFVSALTARGIDEGLISGQMGEYRKTHSAPGSVFDKFTTDPLRMANALAETYKKNVDLALAGMGVFAEEIGVAWDYIKATVTSTVKEWCERRIALAQKELNKFKPLTKEEAEKAEEREKAAQSLRGRIEFAMKEFGESAEEDLKDALKEKLTDGGTWGKITESYSTCTLDTDGLKSLGAMLVAPVVKRIMKHLPIEPAQIVSGADLSALGAGALDSIAIPEPWRAKVARSGAPAPEPKRHSTKELFPTAFREKVVDTNANRDIVENKEVVAQYSALSIFNAKIWGYVWVSGEFEPVSVDPPILDWSTRQLTDTGYSAGGVTVTGRWHRVPLLAGWYALERSDGTYEWLNKLWRTSLGFAEGIIERQDSIAELYVDRF